RLVPADALPLLAAGLANLRILGPRLRLDEVQQRRTLRAQRAAVGGMIGIPLDMVNLRLLALLHIAAAVHDDAAGNRAIGAGVARLGRLRELERPDVGGDLSLRLAETECRNGRPRRTGPCQLHKVPARDFDVHGMATSSNAPLEVLV